MTLRDETIGWMLTVLLLGAATRVATRYIYNDWPVAAVPALAPANPPDVHAIEQRRLSVVAGDPFRIERHPALIPFDPARGSTPAPLAPTQPHTVATLTLRGIVGGPPWQALIEGLPGRPEPTLAHVGDHFGDLIIRSVRKDVVIVVGTDTTWRLTVSRSWQ